MTKRKEIIWSLILLTMLYVIAGIMFSWFGG